MAIATTMLLAWKMGGIMARRTQLSCVLSLVLSFSRTFIVGFAVASYASVHIAEPGFDPPWYQLIPMFAAMGMFGALVGTSVRKQMVRYYFPSGTACAVGTLAAR